MDLTLKTNPALATDVTPPSDCYIIDKDYYAILTIAETSLALLIYTLILGGAIHKVGWNPLGRQGYVTILIFYACEIAALALYIYSYTEKGNPNKRARTETIPEVILHTALNSILFYYAYQLRVVQYKLESEYYVQHNKLINRLNKTFILIGLMTGATLALEVYEKAFMNKEGNGKEFNV